MNGAVKTVTRFASERAGGWAHEQQAGERASEQAKRGQLSAVR